MSGLLAGKVWRSGLGPKLKPLAAALADIAHDDGSGLYPSVAYVSWLTGRSKRVVQDGISALRKAGVLEVVENRKGGRGKTVHYHFQAEALPAREGWQRVLPTTPINGLKGAENDTKRVQNSAERVQKTTLKGEAGSTRNRYRTVNTNRHKEPEGDTQLRWLEERYSRGKSETQEVSH